MQRDIQLYLPAIFFLTRIGAHFRLIPPFQIELIRRDYTANNGWETFLSYEDPEQGDCFVIPTDSLYFHLDLIARRELLLINQIREKKSLD